MTYNLNIPGWMSEPDLLVLNKLASYVPENGSILEVGCFVGRATSALYSGKPTSATLEVIDKFTVEKGYVNMIDDLTLDGESFYHKLKSQKLSQGTGSWLEAFKFCMTPEIFNQLVVNVTNSRDYKITKHFDMVFIDANHNEDEVIYDIKKYSTENTLLVGDDFVNKHRGIVNALVSVRKKIPRTILVPEDSKIWIMVPTSGYWKDVFQKNISNILF